MLYVETRASEIIHVVHDFWTVAVWTINPLVPPTLYDREAERDLAGVPEANKEQKGKTKDDRRATG